MSMDQRAWATALMAPCLVSILKGISHNGNEVGPEGLLEVASPATFQNNLEVMGSTTFKGLTTFEGSTDLNSGT